MIGPGQPQRSRESTQNYLFTLDYYQSSLYLVCVHLCEISQYSERQVRLTELHALLPLEQYKTVINHNWNHSAVSIWPEVKHEVMAAALLPCPLCLMDPW